MRIFILIPLILATACGPSSVTPAPFVVPHTTQTPAITEALPASLPPSASPLPSVTTSPTPVPLSVPTVASFDAVVTVDLLSCRYGPGPEYLYLFALRRDAPVKVIGRTDGSNWVWLEGKNRCWVNARYLDVQGDQLRLPVVYPGPAHLPSSPYYTPTTVLSAARIGDSITVNWLEIPLRPGDEEDESMLHYIVEVWRCDAGQLIFDPLATNETSITFLDQAGCDQPSHGRIFVQEKHGFAGPAEIPWP
jgi:hypothetical protein